MPSTGQTIRKLRPTRHGPGRRWRFPPASDLVFYISITIVAAVLVAIFWTMFAAP